MVARWTMALPMPRSPNGCTTASTRNPSVIKPKSAGVRRRASSTPTANWDTAPNPDPTRRHRAARAVRAVRALSGRRQRASLPREPMAAQGQSQRSTSKTAHHRHKQSRGDQREEKPFPSTSQELIWISVPCLPLPMIQPVRALTVATQPHLEEMGIPNVELLLARQVAQISVEPVGPGRKPALGEEVGAERSRRDPSVRKSTSGRHRKRRRRG